MTRQPVRRRVEAASGRRGLLGVLGVRTRVHVHFVRDGGELAVATGAQAHALNCRRPHPDELEDLLPGERDLHRLLQLARRQDREDRLRMDAQLRSEPAADEG